jgi:hypothetical protein
MSTSMSTPKPDRKDHPDDLDLNLVSTVDDSARKGRLDADQDALILGVSTSGDQVQVQVAVNVHDHDQVDV